MLLSGDLLSCARDIMRSVAFRIWRARSAVSSPRAVRVIFLRPRMKSGCSSMVSSSFIPALMVDWVTLQRSAASINDFLSSNATIYSICLMVGLIMIVFRLCPQK